MEKYLKQKPRSRTSRGYRNDGRNPGSSAHWRQNPAEQVPGPSSSRDTKCMTSKISRVKRMHLMIQPESHLHICKRQSRRSILMMTANMRNTSVRISWTIFYRILRLKMSLNQLKMKLETVKMIKIRLKRVRYLRTILADIISGQDKDLWIFLCVLRVHGRFF